jgi:hypothetical protein
MGRPRSVTDLAERVIRGIERNRPIVIFPRRARLASVIMRISPRLVLAVTRGSVRQEQARRHTQKNPRKPTPPLPLLTRPWTPVPAAWTSEAVVNATRTEIHRWRDLPGIVLGGQNLRRRWGSQPGAIEMRAALQPLRRVAWTVSVWETERDLSNFIRSPHHVAILTPYKERVTVRGITWAARSTDRERLWSEAQQRLEPPLTESKLHPSAPREESA